MGNTNISLENLSMKKLKHLSKDDHKLGIKTYSCSSFIKSEQILIKGQKNNEYKYKNALIVLTDLIFGDIIGTPKSLFSI